ncbi:MAG TPA: hypothetical protein VFQ61_30915, partial [Polyangiaceae bacterium]|nr:hypothetical protein [Polyangiaceae bacterium]
MMRFDHWALHPARLLHDHLLVALRQSPALAQTLFGVRLPPPKRGDGLWDYTTLVLCKASRRYIRKGMRVWDL